LIVNTDLKAFPEKKEKVKGFLPLNLYIYLFCLNTSVSAQGMPLQASLQSQTLTQNHALASMQSIKKIDSISYPYHP
jgi:hypothetical protein